MSITEAINAQADDIHLLRDAAVKWAWELERHGDTRPPGQGATGLSRTRDEVLRDACFSTYESLGVILFKIDRVDLL